MAIRRSVAVAGLALAAALALAQPGRAQSFFSSFYEISPRQIVGMLQDDGYRLRGPMYRRGDVYVCDVVSVSGRSARLIVSARDGRVMERYAVHAHRDREDAPSGLRPPQAVGESGWNGDPNRWGKMALGGDQLGRPARVYGDDGLFAPKSEDAPPAKPKRHSAKKHKEPTVAKAPPSQAAPEAATGDKPAASAPPEAAVAPAPTPQAKPAAPPQPKPAAPPQAKQPAQEAAKPAPMQTNAQADKVAEPKPAASPKPQPPRKKLNDLPVGTLD